MASLLNNSVTK
jgi:hypothetical protein